MSTDFAFWAGEVLAADVKPGNSHDVAETSFTLVKRNVPMDYVSITSDNIHRRSATFCESAGVGSVRVCR